MIAPKGESTWDLARPGANVQTGLPLDLDEAIGRQAAVAAALGSIFRGKFCDLILPDRKTTSFAQDEVIYDVGDDERTFFFLQKGFVKVGALTIDGREVIYDIRKNGDVVGELCVSERTRPDRAVALERTDAISVSFEEVIGLLQKKPELIAMLMSVFSRALKDAYAQVNTLALDDTAHRLIKTLVGLAAKIGQKSGSLIEIPTFLTQEEIAQMAAARRERISTALNCLRRQGLVHYSARGLLMLDVSGLEKLSA